MSSNTKAKTCYVTYAIPKLDNVNDVTVKAEAEPHLKIGTYQKQTGCFFNTPHLNVLDGGKMCEMALDGHNKVVVGKLYQNPKGGQWSCQQ